MSLTISDKKVAKRASGGVLLAAAVAYFYACDDLLLGGPIGVAAVKWGFIPALAFGAITCLIWNVPQTVLFVSGFYPSTSSSSKYQWIVKFVKLVGWCQPPVFLFVQFGVRGGVVGIAGVLLLLCLNSWLSKYRDQADERNETRLGRWSEALWMKHRRWVYVALFFIGPQMALLPVLKARVPIGMAHRWGFKFMVVYSIEFALAWVFLGNSLLGWLIG